MFITTIKFTADNKNLNFNFAISVLKIIKKLQPMINKIMDDFAIFLDSQSGAKSGGTFTGIIKIKVSRYMLAHM